MSRETLIKIRRGVVANIHKASLAEGELAFTTDEKKLYIGTSTGNIQISEQFKGDMKKSIYDVNGNGIVDEAEDSRRLQGCSAGEFVKKEVFTWNHLKGVW